MKPSHSGSFDPTDEGILMQLACKSLREGEERLLYAMLESAIEDYQKYLLAIDRKGKELFSYAEEWLFETDSSSPFSFENICEHLRLTPSYVRKGMLRWKEERLGNHAKLRATG